MTATRGPEAGSDQLEEFGSIQEAEDGGRVLCMKQQQQEQ